MSFSAAGRAARATHSWCGGPREGSADFEFIKWHCHDPNRGSPFKFKTRPPMKMLPFTLAGLSAAFLFGLVRATPIILQGPQGVKQLYPLQISSFLPFVKYSAAAYCQPSRTISWDCGGTDIIDLRISAHSLTTFAAKCDANRDFQPVASGGNGNDIPFCEGLLISLPYVSSHKLVGYVGYTPEHRTVIVAHQGFDVRPL